MKINPNVPMVQQQQNLKKVEQEVKPVINSGKDVEYIPSAKEDEKKITYENPGIKKANQSLIADLKKASDDRYQNLRRMVEEMLSRQGITFKDALSEKAVVVDETTRAEAQAAISEGGELSAEAVSDNIVNFAKALSGQDKSKLDILIGAIDEGFAQARSMLGGTLPDISQRTYDLIMEKLDVWRNE